MHRLLSRTAAVSPLIALLLAGDLHAQARPARRPTMGEAPDAVLRRTRLDVEWNDLTVREAFRSLTRQTNVPFVMTRAAAELAEEAVDLTLDRVAAIQVVRILADRHDLKVLRQGSVLLVTTPEDALRRLAVLRMYDLGALVQSRTDFRGPRLGGLRPSGWIEEEDESEEQIAGMDPDEIVDLLRRGTGEDQWESDAVSIEAVGRRLVVKHSPAMQRKVLRILLALGA